MILKISKKLKIYKQKYNLPKRFIISVGHLEKRKNYPRLIKGIYILKINFKVNFNYWTKSR